MTLLTPIALEIIGYAAAILGGLAVVAYILKMRRRRFEVPFSILWHRVLQEKEATSLWKHLRRFLSLLLILAIIALLLFAAMAPELGEPDSDAKNVLIIVDTSASMKTLDEGAGGQQPRISIAKARALDLLSKLGSGDSAMLMRMDGQTTPLSRFESDIPRLKAVVEKIEATDTPADLRRALSAAGDALRERKNPMLVIIGDGAYPETVLNSVSFEAEATPPATQDGATLQKRLDLIDLHGIDVRYVPVGKKNANAGIVAFNVRRYIANKMSYEVFIEIQNFGTEPTHRKLVLYSGEDPVDVKTIELKPGQKVRQIYPNLSGGTGTVLRASLELVSEVDTQGSDRTGAAQVHDLFPLDDVAYALLPERLKQNVLLVTKDNLYLEGAMLVYDNIQVDKLTPEEYLAANNLDDYHAIFFDEFTPPWDSLPEAAHVLYFAPSGEHSPFAIRSSLPSPRITEINEDHPVMRWLELGDVFFDKSAVFGVNQQAREVVLARSIRSPVIVAKRDGRRKVIATGFGLSSTDLMLRVAFPLFVVNALDWFAGDDSDLITTYTTGHRIRVPIDSTFDLKEVEVLMPGGRRTRAPVSDGFEISGSDVRLKSPPRPTTPGQPRPLLQFATFYASTVGVHELIASSDTEAAAHIQLAANLSNPEESDIEPSTELNMGGKALEQPSGFRITHRQSLWLYLALLVLALLGIEWLTYNRRVTV